MQNYRMALKKDVLFDTGRAWYSFGTPQQKPNERSEKTPMGQPKQDRRPKGLASLNRATGTLSSLLAQQVRELNERQKAAKKSGTPDPGTMKELKEATAVLKDLAAVAKTLNEQGIQTENVQSGVVLLPRVEEEE